MSDDSERLLDIQYVVGKYQQGLWSPATSLAAIARIVSGNLSLKDDR